MYGSNLWTTGDFNVVTFTHGNTVIAASTRSAPTAVSRSAVPGARAAIHH